MLQLRWNRLLCYALLVRLTSASNNPYRTRHEAIAFVRGGGGDEDRDGNRSLALSTEQCRAQINAEKKNQSDGYTILQEDVLYDSWRRLIRRRVLYPDSSQIVDFEVVGQKGETDQAVLIFCWDTHTKTATLVREYMPSVHRIMNGLAAGMVEQDKHQQSTMVAAQHELEEECHMTGGREWILLTPETTGGVTLDKYSMTRLSAYLVLDATPMSDEDKLTKPRDESEEGMEIVEGATVEMIRNWIAQGEMTVVGSWACLLAFDKLKEMGEIP